MKENAINKQRLRSIVDRFLVDEPQTRKLLPRVSLKEVTNVALLTDNYFLLAFLNQKAGSVDESNSVAWPGDFNLASFLLASKSVWPGVPLNETEALKFSLSYYNQYFDSLPEGANLGPQVQTAYLIGELFRRVGEYPQSRKFFSLAISLGETCLQKEKETYRSAFARKIIDLANRQQSLIEKKQQDLRP